MQEQPPPHLAPFLPHLAPFSPTPDPVPAPPSTHWAPSEPERLVWGVLAPPEWAVESCLEPGTRWGDSEQDLALAAWFTAFTVSKTRW